MCFLGAGVVTFPSVGGKEGMGWVVVGRGGEGEAEKKLVDLRGFFSLTPKTSFKKLVQVLSLLYVLASLSQTNKQNISGKKKGSRFPVQADLKMKLNPKVKM